MADFSSFDVLVVGGSYAGLSAAMALGRSLRKVLVIDSGNPCNRPTPQAHNFLTRDGQAPAEIAAVAREQVAAYPTVSFLEGKVVQGKALSGGFELQTEAGDLLRGQKVIFATGVRDLLPEIPGFAACWGISVIHCPYCHGYEFRGRPTGILANGEHAFHYAGLVRNLSPQVEIFTNGSPSFSPDQLTQLKALGVRVDATEVAEIIHKEGQLKGLVLADGRQVELDALYASVPFVQHSDVPASLGCAVTPEGYLQVDGFQATTVPGVFACGDNTTMFRAIAHAVASGNTAGAVVNMELVQGE